MNRNPEGKGGFQDHPELINPGGRPKHNITYWMNQFLAMPWEEFEEYEEAHPERTMAEFIAWARVSKSRKKLDESTFVANRTEGMPKQVMAFDDDNITKVKVKIEVNKDGTKPTGDQSIRPELSGVPKENKTDSESGGVKVEQNLVDSPIIPNNPN